MYGYAGSMFSLALRLPRIRRCKSAVDLLVCVDTLGLARVVFCIALIAGEAPGARKERESHSSDQSGRSAQAIAPVPRE